MKKSIKGTSILEAMIVLLVITTWVVGMYWIFFESKNLVDSTADRFMAIEIAREWIEALENIRDTNWIMYWADYKNCWNSYNYNINCVADNTTTYDIPNNSWWYIVYRNANDKWELKNYPSWTYTWAYITNYRVWLDVNWFYTQSWITDPIIPIYTREIQINYLDTDSGWAPDSNDEKMKISSIVRWKNNERDDVREIILESVLSNWKNKKEF